jgi:hypothetical protein
MDVSLSIKLQLVSLHQFFSFVDADINSIHLFIFVPIFKIFSFFYLFRRAFISPTVKTFSSRKLYFFPISFILCSLLEHVSQKAYLYESDIV